MIYHIINDQGSPWDDENNCPGGGSCIGQTSELGHARMLARLYSETLRVEGRHGEIHVFTVDQYGECRRIDWRAGVEAGELAEVA